MHRFNKNYKFMINTLNSNGLYNKYFNQINKTQDI